jgi:DNA/RNA-binding domain of Phe-tRNA-synthetase-like protein
MFGVSESWKAAYPGAAVGILAMSGVANPACHAVLEKRKKALEEELRSRFAGFDREALRRVPTMQAYHAYYRRFRKTYHLQLQLESVVFKGKPIPGVAALVEAMFMAELKSLLLTAGHDLDVVREPVGIKVAHGNERYLRLNGREQTLKAGDMMIADAEGVISSVLYGPDRRTRIGPETRSVLFTVYAPVGIAREALYDHLQDIRRNVLLISPDAVVITQEVYGTG